MKPVSKLELEVVELSERLAPLSSADLRYARIAGVVHLGLYNGKSVKCADCGHVWVQRGLNKRVRCPHCGTVLSVVNTKKRRWSEITYMLVLQSCKGLQVCRWFRLKWTCAAQCGRTMQIDEVVQHWITQDGKLYVMARNRYMSWYYDAFNLTEPMSLKRNSGHMAYHLSYYGLIVKSVTPILKRNGLKANLYGMRPYELIRNLLTNPFAETLIKTGYGWLLRELSHDGKTRDQDYISASKIAIRNHYQLKNSEDARLWVDLIRNLITLGKDIHNRYYVCPVDLRLAHDRAVELVAIKRRREAQEREAKQKRKDEMLARTYVKRMEKYFGLVITDGVVVICVLKNIAEFEAEGKAMHHCVFANSYFAKENSLVMSAKVEGERVETVEVNLKTFQVVQSRGVNNGVTSYHDQIVDLVNANMWQIKKLYAS